MMFDRRFQDRAYLGTGDKEGNEVENCSLGADAVRVHDEAVKVRNEDPPVI